mmetsp:Transcript_23360/g.46559  ORF Transcript_23360/g.46559 Transcript_23360/m.46559 type:complete len:422 (+) Transcript_23360:309-1574(+)
MISNAIISLIVATAIFADQVCPFHLSREKNRNMRTKFRSKFPLRAQSSSRVDIEINRSCPTTDVSEKSAKGFLAPYGSQFLSPTFNVYIEDTDAYGVIYNSNYLRAYERAMSHYHRGLDDLSNEKSRRWILSEIDNQKFLSSPGLGEEYVVRGELLERPSVDEEVWKVELTSEQYDARKVHNSATITLSRSSSLVRQGSADGFDGNGKTFEKKFTSYHDEFDAHHYDPTYFSDSNFVRTHLLPNHHIPLRNAMNFFERSRTDYLGGPDSLSRMQIEEDLMWVVTGIDSGKLFWDSFVLENGEILLPNYFPESCMDSKESANYADEDRDMLHNSTILTEGMALHPKPGSELTVQTNFVAKRRGMIIVCHHRLWMDVGDLKRKTRRLLAQSTVTIMALKGSTRRPTSKLPQWLLDIISAPLDK